MRYLLCTLGMLLLSVPGNLFAQTDARVDSRAVPVRVAPNSSIQGVVYEDAPVQVLEERAGWTRVRVTGWIPTKTLQKGLNDKQKGRPAVWDAGHQFVVRDLLIINELSGIKLAGKVDNRSDTDYKFVNFKFTIYDSTEQVIGREESAVLMIDAGKTKPIARSFWDVSLEDIHRIDIKCVKAISNSFK